MAKARFRKAESAKIATQIMAQFLGFEPGMWVWCSECQKCYRVGEDRIGANGFNYCNYQDCDGLTMIDAQKWSNVRFLYPMYPEIPERNTIYPCEFELSGVWYG